ncbi:MAG: energy-coupling factor transporter ATPase, partial [Anaerolineaceae bacterium]|nr:energy-coupling factor transporter ATPase [Anaerolineaceae bacterium]
FVPELPPGILSLPDLLTALPDFHGDRLGSGAENQPAAGGDPLIDVNALGYVYLRGTPVEQRALHNVSLKVPAGQAHGLAGITGSGKSTLLQHLNGLLRPQEGRVRVGKFDLNDLKLDRRDVVREVGLVFQNPEVQFFEYYVGDEIAFGPRQLKIAEPGNPLLADRVREAMEQVGLDFEGFKDRPLFTLSGGERRKVALASTLALKPSVLLLDEPTAGLDPRSRRDLLSLLKEMQSSGMTILLSSHQMEDMAVLTQAVTVIEKGSVVFSASTEEVFADPPRVRSFGLDLPAAAQVADGLRKKGWPVSTGVLTTKGLANWVSALQEGEQPESRGAAPAQEER